MEKYIDYIENTLADEADSTTLYRYKRQLLDQMTARANEITRAGLKDEQVMLDLIRDEFPDLQAGYREFEEQERRKKRTRTRRKAALIGTPCYLLLLTALYLAVSFLTGRWAQTWLMMVGGVFLMLIFYSVFAIKKLCGMRRLFHPIARVLIAVDIMLAATFVFLFCLMLFDLPHVWVVLIAGVIALLAGDAVFAAVTRQKLAVINYLLYIPAVSALLYVILGACGVIPWSPGWMLVLLGVLADILVIAGVMVNNSRYKYKPEVDDVWNEN